MGGNIGVPFSGIVEKVSSDGIIVLELSSFQLEWIEEFRPHVAAVLNITPDHLDRHADMNSYVAAKLRILENQTENDFAVLNVDDEGSLKFAAFGKSKKAFFSTKSEPEPGAFIRGEKLFTRSNGRETEIIGIKDIGIKGPHNLSNACAACAICSILGIAPDSMRKTLAGFTGVEHRLEPVAVISGVSFVNDSKGTNVDSVWYALQSVPPPIILIAGGKDKGGDFTRLKDLVLKNVKALILIGEAEEKIKSALGDVVTVYHSDSLEEAVELSYKKATAQDTVLLSPGCASFDMFRDYQHRGQVFKTSVRNLSPKSNATIFF